MPFIDRLILRDQNIPAVVYLHDFGFYQAYGANLRYMRQFALEAIEFSKKLMFQAAVPEVDLLTAVVFGDPDSNSRLTDVVGKKGMNPWPGNPDSHPWATRGDDELLDHGYAAGPNPSAKMCGDSEIMRGREEEHRRKRVSLRDYLENPMSLEVLAKLGVFKPLQH